jgi:hypothetical protein
VAAVPALRARATARRAANLPAEVATEVAVVAVPAAEVEVVVAAPAEAEATLADTGDNQRDSPSLIAP